MNWIEQINMQEGCQIYEVLVKYFKQKANQQLTENEK